MQTRIGKLLVAIAIIVWVLGGIVGIGLGIANAGYREDVNLLTMVLYWVIFFIVGTLYYGFAILVDRVICLRDESAQNLSGILSTVTRLASVMEAKAAQPQPIAAVKPAYAFPSAANSPDAAIAYHKSEMTYPVSEKIVCPNCGQTQRADRKLCLQCGAAFIDHPAPQPAAPAPVSPPSAMEGQIFCTKCGKQQSDKRDNCYWCGAQLSR